MRAGSMAPLVKVRERGLGLLRPMLNGGPVCDVEGGICENAALYKWSLPFAFTFRFNVARQILVPDTFLSSYANAEMTLH